MIDENTIRKLFKYLIIAENIQSKLDEADKEQTKIVDLKITYNNLPKELVKLLNRFNKCWRELCDKKFEMEDITTDIDNWLSDNENLD